MWEEIGLNFGLAFGVVFVGVFGVCSLIWIMLPVRFKEELRYSLSGISMVARFGILLSLLSLSFFVFSASSVVHLLRDYSSITSQPVKALYMDIISEIPGADEPLNPPLELNLWREGLTDEQIKATQDSWLP